MKCATRRSRDGQAVQIPLTGQGRRAGYRLRNEEGKRRDMIGGRRYPVHFGRPRRQQGDLDGIGKDRAAAVGNLRGIPRHLVSFDCDRGRVGVVGRTWNGNAIAQPLVREQAKTARPDGEDVDVTGRQPDRKRPSGDQRRGDRIYRDDDGRRHHRAAGIGRLQRVAAAVRRIGREYAQAVPGLSIQQYAVLVPLECHRITALDRDVEGNIRAASPRPARHYRKTGPSGRVTGASPRAWSPA